MSIISFNSNIPQENYERVFGHRERKEIKIEYKRNPDLDHVTPPQTTINLVGDDGRIISKVNTYHKNKLYKQAKDLREKLGNTMCTKSECWNPTKENVNKMICEMKNPKVQSYKMAMQAIGADPKDSNPENLRRGR
jgi:hypothetical protein